MINLNSREASLSTGKYSKLVLTARGGDRSVVRWSVATVRLPVVGTVIVSRPRQALALVVEEAIAAGLQSQGSIGTLVELVTVVLLGVELESLKLGTGGVSDQLTGGRSLALWRSRRQRSGSLCLGRRSWGR